MRGPLWSPVAPSSRPAAFWTTPAALRSQGRAAIYACSPTRRSPAAASWRRTTVHMGITLRYSAPPPVTLTNVDNTIIGAGQIGDSAGFCLVNEAGAVIEADVLQHRLIVGSSSYPGDQIVNDGLMSAAAGNHSASSFLEIDHATVSGAGGTIAAGADSNVAIMYSQVSGQTFSAAPGGQIQIFHSRIALGGTLDDPGLLQLSAVVLTIDSGLTLTGGGAMVIHGGRMVGDRAGVTLTNVDGAISMVKADLGAGKLALTNEAHGTILCEGAIDTGARTITNAGLMESDANRRQVRGVIMSALKNTGTLSTGTGGTLVFDDAVTGSGQALISSNKFGGGLLGFTSSFDENVTFSRHKDSDPVSVLQLAKSQSYAATITGFSSTGKNPPRPWRHRICRRVASHFQRDRQVRRVDGERRNAHGPHRPGRRLPRIDLRRRQRRPRRDKHRRDDRGRPVRAGVCLGDGGVGRAILGADPRRGGRLSRRASRPAGAERPAGLSVGPGQALKRATRHFRRCEPDIFEHRARIHAGLIVIRLSDRDQALQMYRGAASTRVEICVNVLPSVL